MAAEYSFREEEMAVDERVGYPKAYAKLCRDRGPWPYRHGPPFTFTPFPLQQNEKARARELERLFPVIDPKAKQTARPKIFASLLWKQLSHLGNAGFDPAVIRVDTYGNVLYLHADKASPLAWDIDHWFPCQRGGFTVPSNLRILQWQACKRKHSKLEFLVPWWDFQLGVSVDQFLSIFSSSNSDFRHRAFSLLFSEGENEDLNASQTVDSHSFPQHFLESKEQIGLAPAAIAVSQKEMHRAFSLLFSEGENEDLNASQTVDSHSFPQHFLESKEQIGLAPAAIAVSQKEMYDSSMPLRSLDYNRQIRPHSPAIAARKIKPGELKENEIPDFNSNPYRALVLGRNTLKQREEETQKMQAEIQKLDDEVHEMRRKNDQEKLVIQDLETTLIKRRRRAEKCRKLAEAQSSHRTMLEKMIRDAMHQSVVYKEQARLNQAATTAIMARLEAQKEICDNAERGLIKKFKERDEIEQQIRPKWDARKRSRIDDNISEDRDHKAVLYLPVSRPRTPQHKELREFLEEEQRASEAENEDGKHEEIEEVKYPEIEDECQGLNTGHRGRIQFPFTRERETEEDEDSRKQRGKGNVERWLEMLLDNCPYDEEPGNSNDHEKSRRNDETSTEEKEKIAHEKDEGKTAEETIQRGPRNERDCEKKGMAENGKGTAKSESARFLRRIPSSPLLLGMKKGVECMRKKPLVIDDDDDYCCEDRAAAGNSFIKSSMNSIKKAVKL